MDAAERQDAKYRQMIETPIPRLVCTLAVPTIISMLVTSIYNMADTFFVGKIGTSGHRRGGGGLFADGDLPGGGLHHRIGSGNLVSRLLGAASGRRRSTWPAPAFTPPLRRASC